MKIWKIFIAGIPIGIVFINKVGYIVRVDGISMQPSLNPNSRKTDFVFLNRWTVNHCGINKGDVVSLTSPKDPEHKLIKRVIGVEGDVIKTRSLKTPIIKIPQGHCWVEGDNTGHSMDSNSFGPVSLGLINAKATVIVWPPTRWQKVKSEKSTEYYLS